MSMLSLAEMQPLSSVQGGPALPGPRPGSGVTNDQHYRLLFESNPLPMWVYDLETLGFLDVNDAACRKYGYTRAEFLALTIRDIRPPADVAAVEDSVRTTPSHAIGSSLWRHRLRDGRLIRVEVTSHELVYAGRRARFVCPIDVTQRLAAEEALGQREAGLRQAQAMARLGHFIVREGGAVESRSESLSAITGLHGERMPATTRAWMQLVHPDDREHFRRVCHEALRLGDRHEMSYRVAHADGRWVAIRQVIEPMAGTGVDGARRWFSTLQDVTEQLQKDERLVYLAAHDPLTGLANDTLLRERLRQEIAIARAGGQRLALVMMDIERFKGINDALGREAGDEVLRELARRLRAAAGGEACVARVGPNHFAFLVPGAKGESDVLRAAEAVSACCFGPVFVVAGEQLRLSARMGIALHPADGAEAELLFRNAEAAVRKAKAGGERALFYNHLMTEAVAEKLALENQLRQALENDEFVLHYQPKVDLDTRRVLGLEALIRWNSPRLGLVPPARFIPLMEETGLILEVGPWALRQAAADRRRWVDAGQPAPRIAVNVSAVQVRRPDFVATVQAALARGARDPGIDIELTESLVMEDVESSIGKLQALRALGVEIAIDDFGTGYSSLAYLTRLPVQTLKIDRSFVATMLDQRDGLTLVSSMISLAHALRLKIVAEGVETEEQARTLHLLRCDQMQGYLFSRPLPFEAVSALLVEAA